MKQILLRCIRIAASIRVLFIHILPTLARYSGKGKLTLVFRHYVLMDRGQYALALDVANKALSLAETKLDYESMVFFSLKLGDTYRILAQYDKALPLLQRALFISEKNLGSEHPETVLVLLDLASIYNNLGQYEKALPLQQRALIIYEKTLSPKHKSIALSLNNLAITYIYLGQYDKALPLQQRALIIYEKVFGIEKLGTISILANLASIYGKLAQYDKALSLELRVLVIFEKFYGSEHPEIARILGNLGNTYHNLTQYDKALPLQQRALIIYEKFHYSAHPNIARALGNLAIAYSDITQYDKVLPLQLRALAIYENTLGPEHPSTANSLRNLAITLTHLDQPELAIAFLKSVVNAYQNQREQASRIDTASLQSYTESVTDTYQGLANLLIDQGLLPDAQLVLDMLKENEQFEFIRRSASADPRLTRIGYNSNEQIWMTRYRQIADRLVALGVEQQALQKHAKLELGMEQKERQQTLASDLRVAQSAFESFLKEMQESFVRQGPAKMVEANATSVAALSELQSLLKEISNEVVLLQYYITDDKVGMLLTTQGVQLARSTNVSAKELNRQIADFRRLLRDPKSDPLKASQTLYQLLVAPVAQDLEQRGAKTVMLSLDGALRYLPFGALHDGQRYLMQRWNLPMYTSVMKNRLKDSSTPKWQAAGLGVTQALGEFAALPAVKSEMRSIIKTIGDGVLPGEVYLDKTFTALRLKDVSQRPFQLLHIASHFRFSPGTEVNSFLLLGDGQQLTLGDIRTQNFRFDNVDLLTLSACDTALGGGRDAQGREIEGFGVIAQQQGAKAVLATLWQVADQSTATLMAEMYRRRQEHHLTKIEALRQAQLSLLAQKRYAHPFYWAPFILMGNWK
ncbi:MAG: tetratricopeptide repeat protein [Undibacterium sp.]|nr:tetratricopeptide repeat protein [Undibacterium sp.]